MPGMLPVGPATALSSLTVGGVPTMGMGSYLFAGNWFYVNETTGSDGNTGGAQDPFKTLTQALSKCTANQNDVVVFQGTIHLTATLAWSKDQVHLLGMDAPIQRGQRARISVSGTTPFSPMVNVSAQGCLFQNFGTFYGFNANSANNAICWTAGGQRNCYDNVEFMGFGDNTTTTGTANRTAARACVVGSAGGNGENTFVGCSFGVDTTTRNATNYTLEFLSGSGTPRNSFYGCVFEALLGGSGTASSHIYAAAASSIDRYQIFENCKFFSDVKSSGSAMAQAINIPASVGGFLLMNSCALVGITKWETTPTNEVYVNGGAATAATTGYSVNNT